MIGGSRFSLILTIFVDWYIDRCVCVRARVMMRDRKKSAEREISEIDLSNLALEREYVLSTSRALEYVFGIYLKLLSDNRVLRIRIRVRYTVIYICPDYIFLLSLSNRRYTARSIGGGGEGGVFRPTNPVPSVTSRPPPPSVA